MRWGNRKALWDKQVQAARWAGGLQGQSVKAKWTVAQTIPKQWAGTEEQMAKSVILGGEEHNKLIFI